MEFGGKGEEVISSTLSVRMVMEADNSLHVDCESTTTISRDRVVVRRQVLEGAANVLHSNTFSTWGDNKSVFLTSTEVDFLGDSVEDIQFNQMSGGNSGFTRKENGDIGVSKPSMFLKEEILISNSDRDVTRFQKMVIKDYKLLSLDSCGKAGANLASITADG
jgi:hypothetical protein